MPEEPVIERLSRFTPDGAALDRDTLLFAAGRASARPARRWVALAGTLAASQLLTLALLWPRTPAPPNPPLVKSMPAVTVTPPEPPDPSELEALRQRLLADDGGLPAPAAAGPLVPDPPPLHVYSVSLPDFPD